MSMFALLTTAALLIAAVVAALPDATPWRTAGARSIWPMAVAFALAGVAAVRAAASGADIAGPLIALLVVALTLVVQLYAERNLRGDPRARVFFVFSSLAALGSASSATAGDLRVLAAGWTLATICTVVLIRSGGEGAQTRAATRRSGAVLLLGDAALWAAVTVAIVATGSASFGALATLAPAPAATVGILVAIAAIARAGSFPLHGWLPATAATTTPVSALLHAGFVNAGAVLLLRFAPVPSEAGPWVAGVAGGLTMLLAGLAMLTRADVKGRLVQSTAAQMGFMLVACATGAFGLALVHVLGHALYKASLFLGAGSALERSLASRTAHRVPRSPRGAAVGAGVVLVAGAAAVVGGDILSHATAVLLLFPLATAAVAGGALGASGASRPARAALVAAVAGAAAAYVLLVFPAAEMLVPVAPAAAVPPPAAAVLFLVAAGTAVIARSSGRLADRVFALGFAWGRPTLPAPPAPAHHTPIRPTVLSGPLEYGSSR